MERALDGGREPHPGFLKEIPRLGGTAAFGDRAENPHLDIGERIAAVSQALIFHEVFWSDVARPMQNTNQLNAILNRAVEE